MKKTIRLITLLLITFKTYANPAKPQDYNKCRRSMDITLPTEFQGTFKSQNGEILKIDRNGVVEYTDKKGMFGWVDFVSNKDKTVFEVESSCFKQSVRSYAQSQVLLMKIKTHYNYLDRHKNYYETSWTKKSYLNIRFEKNPKSNKLPVQSLTITTCEAYDKKFTSSLIETFATGGSTFGGVDCKINSWGNLYDANEYFSVHNNYTDSEGDYRFERIKSKK